MRLCLYCEIEIPKHKDLRQKFCGRSCAAKYNNPKRSPKHICLDCGARLTHSTKNRCHQCRMNLVETQARERPIKDFFVEGASRAKFNHVRRWARKLIDRSNRVKECEMCNFDVVVEVCHLEPIASFPEDTPMGIVNSLDNLIYLCPNHHAMLDKGLLKD